MCGVFWVEENLCKLILLLFISICIVAQDPIIKKRVGIQLTDLSSPHCCAYLKPSPFISYTICEGHFCIQRFEVRGNCSLGWYWWNCWTSLFNLIFLNYTVWGEREVVVCFVDIGGIVDHHCLNFSKYYTFSL